MQAHQISFVMYKHKMEGEGWSISFKEDQGKEEWEKGNMTIRIVLDLQSWKGPYGSSSPAPVKKAQCEIELPTSCSGLSYRMWCTLFNYHVEKYQ